MKITPAKRKFVLLSSLGFCGLLIFYILCSILGINARRSETAKMFIENLWTENYIAAYAMLTNEYQQIFGNDEHLFQISAKAFIVSIPALQKKTTKQDNIYLHAHNSFIFWPTKYQTAHVTISVLQHDLSQWELLKEKVLLFLSPAQIEKKYRNLKIVFTLTDNGWKISACSQASKKLTALSQSTFYKVVTFISKEELLQLGDSYYALGYDDLTQLCYEEYYQRHITWDEHTNEALNRLAIYWQKSGDERAIPLIKQLSTQKQ